MEPETSQSTTSFVLRSLRSLNINSLRSPPVLSDWRTVRRRCTRVPRAEGFHRRLGRAAKRRAMRLATRVTSRSAPSLKVLKSCCPSASRSLGRGIASGCPLGGWIWDSGSGKRVGARRSRAGGGGRTPEAVEQLVEDRVVLGARDE